MSLVTHKNEVMGLSEYGSSCNGGQNKPRLAVEVNRYSYYNDVRGLGFFIEVGLEFVDHEGFKVSS